MDLYLKEDKTEFIPNTPPFFRNSTDPRAVTRDRLICLSAVALPSLFIYGFRMLLAVSAVLCGALAAEAGWHLLRGKRQTFGDLTAFTAAIATLCLLPPGLPLGIVLICAILAVAVCKIPFGEGVRPPINPAAGGAVFAAFFGGVTKSIWSTNGIPAGDINLYDSINGNFFEYFGVRNVLPFFSSGVSPDGTSLSARLDPLVVLNAGGDPSLSFWDFIFFGFNGTVGGISVLLVIVSAVFLYYRRSIRIEAPVSFLTAMIVISFVIPYAGISRPMSPVYSIFCGETLFAAVFLIGDQYTSSNLRGGRILYGICCALLTFSLRRSGLFPSETALAVLIMNLLSNQIDLLAWEIRSRGVSYTKLMDNLIGRFGKKKRDEDEVTI